MSVPRSVLMRADGDGDVVDCALCDEPTRRRDAVPCYCDPLPGDGTEGGYTFVCASCHHGWAPGNEGDQQ